MLLKLTTSRSRLEVETDEDDLGVDLEAFLLDAPTGTIITIEILEDES